MLHSLKKIGIYSAVILVIPFITVLSIFVYNSFNLKNLIIINKKTTFSGLSQLNGANILFLDLQKVSLNLLKLNSSFLTINLSKKYPNTLILEIVNRKPAAKIQAGNIYKYIDHEGILFTDDDTFSDLPLINIPEISIYKNQKADWRVLKAIAFIDEGVSRSIKIEQISGSDSDNVFTIKLSSGTEIMLPYTADIGVKASSLQLIILRFRIEGKNIDRIDFRFDKPVVTLSNGEKISSNE